MQIASGSRASTQTMYKYTDGYILSVFLNLYDCNNVIKKNKEMRKISGGSSLQF